ncbi:MAG: WG repeat-containing protein [Firmicutes bacterium]|nr:WG repeat-containing protein [Bacillota bacterium]
MKKRRKRKKKTSNKVFSFIIVVFLIVLFFVLGVIIINKILLDTKDNVINKKEENVNDVDKDNDIESGVIDEYYEEEVVLKEGFDGYYIGYYDTSFYLGRNGKKVSELLEVPVQIYKDPTDINSKYIGVGYLDGEYIFSSSYIDSSNIVVGSSGDNNNIYVSMIYNEDTGNYKKYNGFLNNIDIIKNSGKKYYSLSVINSLGVMVSNTIIDGSSLLPIIDSSKYIICGSNSLNVYEEKIENYSNNYIVVKNKINGKYGVSDFTGNLIINCLYDDLYIIQDEYILAKKDGKFGVINFYNKVIVDFKYDGIDGYNGYFAVLKDGKMGVIDMNNNLVVPIFIDVYQPYDFKFRVNDDAPNGFKVLKGELGDNKKMIIDYYDRTIIDSDSMIGYESRYLTILEDNKYLIES